MDGCAACKNDKDFGCATAVCVVFSNTKIPKQFDNICEFYKELNRQTYPKKGAYASVFYYFSAAKLNRDKNGAFLAKCAN